MMSDDTLLMEANMDATHISVSLYILKVVSHLVNSVLYFVVFIFICCKEKIFFS